MQTRTKCKKNTIKTIPPKKKAEKETYTIVLDQNMTYDNMHSVPGSSDDDDEIVRVKKKSYFPVTDAVYKYRRVQNNCSQLHRKFIKFTINVRHRVRAKCKAPCLWVCYASSEKV